MERRETISILLATLGLTGLERAYIAYQASYERARLRAKVRFALLAPSVAVGAMLSVYAACAVGLAFRRELARAATRSSVSENR
jgi:hypothetical protein